MMVVPETFGAERQAVTESAEQSTVPHSERHG